MRQSRSRKKPANKRAKKIGRRIPGPRDLRIKAVKIWDAKGRLHQRRPLLASLFIHILFGNFHIHIQGGPQKKEPSPHEILTKKKPVHKK